MSLIIATLEAAQHVQTLVPTGGGINFDPKPQEVPGMGNLSTIINWVAWGAAIICGITILACGAWIAVSVFTGSEVRAAKGLIIAIVACLFVGGAGAIVGALF